MIAAWRVPLADRNLCDLILALYISGTSYRPTIWINYKQTQHTPTRYRDSAEATIVAAHGSSFIVGMDVFLLGRKQAAYIEVSICSHWQLPMKHP